MSDKPTTSLPAAATPDGTELFPGVQGGNSRKFTKTQITQPVVQAIVTAATATPAFGQDLVKITALAVDCEVMNWTGTAIPGWGLVFRVKDNGTAHAITWDTKYRACGAALPTTTTAGKITYVGFIYNSDDDKYDCVSAVTQA